MEHSLLQEIIIKNSNQINLISNKLPQIAIKDIIIKILSILLSCLAKATFTSSSNISNLAKGSKIIVEFA